MRRLFTLFLAFTSAGTALQAQTSFTTGNLVVVRVGSPDSVLSNRSREVFLEEYTTSGSLVQTIPLSFAPGPNQITVGGTSTTEGNLSLSTDKKYLTLGGYKLGLGVSSPTQSAANADRVILRIDKDVNITSTVLPYANLYPGNAFRSVVTADGTQYWTAGGTQGCYTVAHGSNTSTLVSGTVTNLRTANILFDQVYITHASGTTYGRVMAVGTGLPTSAGNTMTALPGLPAAGSACSPVLLDLDPGVSGPDVLYLADDGAGILKYSLVGGNWVSNGGIGIDEDYRGLVASVAPNGTVTLFSTRKGGGVAAGGGELVKIDDASGYNAAAGSPTITVLATAATNTAFRGVAFAPQDQALPLNLLSFSASQTNRGQMLQWITSGEIGTREFEVERSSNGTTFRRITSVEAKGGIGRNSYQVEDTEPISATVYYRLRMIDKDGSQKYSKTLSMSPARSGKFNIFPNPLPGNNQLTISHNVTGGKASIGIYTTDGRQLIRYAVPVNAVQTSLNIGELPAGTYRVVLDNNGNRQSELLIKQ